MLKAEFIRRLVLNEVTDDYESLDKICHEVTQVGSRCGVPICCPEVVTALAELIQAGMVTAYWLSGTEDARAIDGVPLAKDFTDVYFWTTPKGLQIHKSDETWWPFDDEGSLKPEWAPPE